MTALRAPGSSPLWCGSDCVFTCACFDEQLSVVSMRPGLSAREALLGEQLKSAPKIREQACLG